MPAVPLAMASSWLPSNTTAPSLSLAHDGVDGETWVGAVTDIIAQKNEPADAGAPCMLKARLERFSVGVNVAEEPHPHRITRARPRLEFGNVSLSLTAVNGVDLQQYSAQGGFEPN